MSLDHVKIGFIPLVDAAVPIVAADLGFAAAEGIEIELFREISWSNIRDRLTLGHFDAAHLLAPLAIATSLGLNSIKAPLAVPLALNLNGNAVTLAPHFHDELMERLPAGADPADPRATGAALKRLAEDRRAHGEQPPVLGMTFPFSTHNYQLRLWIAAAGLNPDEDVRLAVVPPPYMVDALENAHVEGFCVGAPWNSVAVELGLGRILHLGVDFATSCPEKVLAVRESWLGERPELAARLIRAMVAAGEWLERSEHRQEAAELLGASSRLDVAPAIIRRALDGRLATGVGDQALTDDRYLVFARDGAMRPDERHARWLHGQMARWGQTGDGPDEEALAAAVYRPSAFDSAIGGPISVAADPLGLKIGGSVQSG